MISFFTAGESHGPKLTAIVEGIPAGLPLEKADIDKELARRQKGFGSGGRMRIEQDRVEISSGVLKGKTTGAPIALTVPNCDFGNWQNKQIAPMTIPRPGHADLTGAIKYGYDDLRLSLERASARETTMRVAVGAICKKLLQECNILIGGWVVQIGSVRHEVVNNSSLEELSAQAEQSPVRAISPEASEQMDQEIRRAIKAQDTLGGIMEIRAQGVPPGLGSYVHYEKRLDSLLAAAMLSIPAMKGVEIGPAFTNAGKLGSQVHDEIVVRDNQGTLGHASNRAGGIEGGISNGEQIIVRVAMKPISTIVKGNRSVDLASGETKNNVYERSDFCALPRAVPIGEAMLAIVLTKVLLAKVGGDSLPEILPRFASLRQAHLKDLKMANDNWQWHYE